MNNADREQQYLRILHEELIGAMGCTEPIALAYAGARAREVLGKMPQKVCAQCSGNMIKNVRCVTIPNSGNQMGIEAAVMLGIIGGNASAKMEVLKDITPEHRAKLYEIIKTRCCSVEYLQSNIPLHIILTLIADNDRVELEIKHAHLNIVRIEKNGETLYKNDRVESIKNTIQHDRSLLSIEGIKDFADNIELDKIQSLMDQQIRCNMDIAYEGMSGDYGVGIGRMIKNNYPECVLTRMKAYTAAASEARMDGCEMPVIINSGSGNQGLTSSIPVIVYARENSIPREKLYRALVFSNLMTIYQKEYIGKLSAFCGAVSASCAAGSALTYICGGTLQNIIDTIDNTLANIPGMICDGAKISCAAKIASALDAAYMAHILAMNGRGYGAYTGILQGSIGETISSVGYIGRVGMMETDREIIQMMLKTKK